MSKKRLKGYTNYQRRNQRLETPVICLVVDGRIYRTVDWSLGGFLLRGYPGLVLPGDRITVRGIGPDPDNIQVVNLRARIVRLDQGMRIAARFEGLTEAGFDLLQALMMHRLPVADEPQKMAG